MAGVQRRQEREEGRREGQRVSHHSTQLSEKVQTPSHVPTTHPPKTLKPKPVLIPGEGEREEGGKGRSVEW